MYVVVRKKYNKYVCGIVRMYPIKIKKSYKVASSVVSLFSLQEQT